MMRLFLVAVLFCLSISVAYAATGFNVLPLLATNTSGSTAMAPKLGFPLSSQGLITGSWMSSTALNTEMQQGGVAIGSMPGTGRVRVLACFNNAAVDETTACNNATANDITLPAAAAQVYEFAADSQFRHLWLNLSTAGVATWDFAFEYYNGASYVALAGVTDETNELTVAGLNRISWTFPGATLWAQSALHGVTGYWMRLRVSAFTALTTAPLGQQAYYETGRWWTTTSSILDNEQERFDLHLDTTATTSTTTTFSVGASDDDVEINGVASVGYPPAFSAVSSTGTSVVVTRSLNGGLYDLADMYLRFNTAALPDFISPDSATLACRVSGTADADGRELAGDWYNWSGTLGEKDYNTGAANHALAGQDITTITILAVNTWTLQNLHQINKAGYTGIRLSISGGVPAGGNQVGIVTQDHATLPECVLSVTYDGIRAYHNFFPHDSGYTLADAAALEPAQAFELTLAGFFNADAAVGTDIISKGTAVEWTVAAGNVVEAYINGVNEADFTGVSTGYHVLNLRQIGGGGVNRMEAVVDGVITGTSAAAVTVPNNATAWTFGVALPYLEYLEIEIGGNKQLTHQIRALPTHEVINQANPGTFDVTVRYPDTVAGFTLAVLPLEPTGLTFSADPDFSAEFVDAPGELTNLEPSEHLNDPTFPLLVLIKIIADNSSGALPYQSLLILLAFGLCVGAMIGSWAAFHSVHITWFAMVAASVSFIFVGDGIWPWAIPFAVAITGAVYIFWRRAAV